MLWERWSGTQACLMPPHPPCRYKKYVFLDPLAGAVTKTHVMLGAETEEKLFDAPLSISKREQLEQQVEREAVWMGGVSALSGCFSRRRLC